MILLFLVFYSPKNKPDNPLARWWNDSRLGDLIMRQNALLEKLVADQLRTDIPEFRAGDSVRVHARIVEGSRERVQMFEGVVIKRKGTGIQATYTVRKISNGVGVERTFPLHSPRVDKIEVTRHGRVRRAKLYYLRALHGKAARIREARRA